MSVKCNKWSIQRWNRATLWNASFNQIVWWFSHCFSGHFFLVSKYFRLLPFLPPWPFCYHFSDIFHHFQDREREKYLTEKKWLREKNICGKKIFEGKIIFVVKQCLKKQKDGETRRKCLKKRKIFETEIIIFKTNRRKLILRNSVFLISLYCCCWKRHSSVFASLTSIIIIY